MNSHNPQLEAYKFLLSPQFTKASLQYAVNNFFYFPSELRMALESYSQIRMNGKQFKGELIEGCMIRNGISYNVIYTDCNMYSAKKARELKLSFRKVLGSFGIEPTVLVKVSVDCDGIRETN